MAERNSTRTASRRTTPQPAPQAAGVAASQSPPKRTTRKTRSQSRDISDSEDGRKGARARLGAKDVIPGEVGSDPTRSTTKSRREKVLNGPRVLQDLPTVTEHPSVAYPDLGSGDEEDREQIGGEQPTEQPSKSPGGASAFSGTTARTSLSARELSDISSEELLDALPDLAAASNKMLALLVPSPLSEASVKGIVDQLRTKDSRANKNLRRLCSSFQVQKDIFGSESYISQRRTLRVLLGTKQTSDLGAAQWGPEALLHKANLAVLASDILSHSMQEQADQIVEELEQAFPSSFLEGFVQSETPTTESSALSLETLRLAIEIRTQYAVHSLARHVGQHNFDFDEVLHQVFYKSEKNLNGWAIVGLRAEDLTEGVQDAIIQRLDELRNAFAASAQTPSACIDELKGRYPWATLIQLTMSWISQRLNEIETQIEMLGGIEDIHQNLSNQIQQSRLEAESMMNDNDNDDGASPQLVLNYDLPSEASLTTSDQQTNASLPARVRKLRVPYFSANSPKALSVMKSLKGRLEGPKAANPAQSRPIQPAHQSSSNVQVISTARQPIARTPMEGQANEPQIPASAPDQVSDEQQEHAQQHGDWQPQEDDDEPFHNPAEDPFATAALALKAKSDAESNKENIAEPSEPQRDIQTQRGQRRLIDPQPGAQQVFFESQDSNVNRQVEDVSEDEGFQQQNLPETTALKRMTKPATKRPATEPTRNQVRSPKKVRMEGPSPSRSHTATSNRDQERPAPSRSQSRVRDRDDVRPSPSQLEEYRTANDAAKEKKAFELKPVQTRTPWSEEETERLLELIVKHGSSWKLLMQEDEKYEESEGGPLLQKRGQVALKDKARNMKMDYLKTTRWLPENFDRIPINKLQIDRLKSENIAYDPETGQREDALVDSD